MSNYDRNVYVECKCVRDAKDKAMLRETNVVRLLAVVFMKISDVNRETTTYELHDGDCPKLDKYYD